MSQTPSTLQAVDHDASLRFPVRRDGWDTVDFYLLLFTGQMVASVGMITMATNTLRSDPARSLSWILLLMGIGNFAFGAIECVLRTWRRFAEQYELTEAEFILHTGYSRQRGLLREISRVHPVKICRSTSALKPAVRIVFRRLPGDSEDASPGRAIDFDLPGYTRSVRLPTTWSLDVSPVNREGFLEELAIRCPHLERNGERFMTKIDDSQDVGRDPVTSPRWPPVRSG